MVLFPKLGSAKLPTNAVVISITNDIERVISDEEPILFAPLNGSNNVITGDPKTFGTV